MAQSQCSSGNDFQSALSFLKTCTINKIFAVSINLTLVKLSTLEMASKVSEIHPVKVSSKVVLLFND